MRMLITPIALAVALLLQLAELARAATFAPNQQLGTCLDEAWVKKVEAELSISRYDRDESGRLVHPHLRPALKTSRFTVVDPRTAKATASLYRDDCKATGSLFYGYGARLDDSGKIANPGRVNGTLVLEIKGWDSANLMTMVTAIIIQELLGYEVSLFRVDDVEDVTQRMSSVGAGLCTPVHMSVEVWTDSASMKKYALYSEESYSSGSIGYPGRSGMFTTLDFVKQGLDATKFSPTFAADFWRDYVKNEDLIKSFPVAALKGNAKYFPPATVSCADGVLGCKSACAKTAACFEREAKGLGCMMVVLSAARKEPGYLPAVLENNDIPAEMCYIGFGTLDSYVVEMQAQGRPTLFFHQEPGSFHRKYPGLFERVMLPRSTPEKTLLNTGTFGEYGNGKKTDNPVRVDFPVTSLQKYSSTLTQDLPLVNSLVARMAMNEIEIGKLLDILLATASATPAVPDTKFAAACTWLRNSYAVWHLWLGRLPICDEFFYLAHDYIGCNGENATAFPREVRSRWLEPDPTNSSLPYNCDGGLLAPPEPFLTSKSCEWLLENRVIWVFWFAYGRPACDPSYYTFDVSGCDFANSKRKVMYHWKIPNDTNASLSAECRGGVTLPTPVLLECGYVPHGDSRFIAVLVLAIVLAAVFFVGLVFVYWNRAQPIIKRSQYQFLLALLLGGILVCSAAWSYAGLPSDALCTTRPVTITYGFTLIFGSLVVKSLRVYRVFLSGAMKRVVLSTKTMFKILFVFLMIDTVILVAWSAIDPPLAKIAQVATPEIGGGIINRHLCTSSGFIFTALLIFWKAILLFSGLYLVIILALAYLVELPAITFFMFFALMLLVATAIVMALMLIPKILRLHERAADTTTSSTSGGENRPSNSSNTSGSGGAAGKLKSIVPGFFPGSTNRNNNDKDATRKKSSKVQVTPVQQFTINDE
ncbi:hypothetical protein PybrP1_012118 [[Pythium] brassicae (nom. inval.)]|nr:hypothetical protein PybrP1_012118 [[Pythium] brassicae (nom. inval.)]